MLRNAILGSLTLLFAASWGLAAQPAGAATAAPLAQVTILPTAALDDGGQLMTVRLRILCQPNGTNDIQWEGFVDATQPGVFGWTELELDCDGRQHVEEVVLSGTPSFTTGDAMVSVVIQDENTLTSYASDARTVKVR